MSLSKKRTLTSTGIQNALDRQGASRIFIDALGTVTLNGIAGGVDGLIIFLYTGSFTTLIINNLDGAALSADRIATHTGTTVTITARGGTSLIYDGATGNWRIYGFADENASWNSKGNAGTVPGTNFIGTTDNQAFVTRTGNVERMRILNTGEVGIGTNSPSSKLHIANTGIVTTPIANTALTLENNGDLFLSMMSGATSTANSGLIFGSTLGNQKGRLLYTPFTNQMDFSTNDLTRMSITGAGNVGIGTTAPSQKLHVAGNGIITGNLAVGTTTNNAALHVAGDYAVSGKVEITASINNLNRNGKSVIKVSGGGVVILSGIAGGVDGMIVHIYVTQSTDLTIAEDSGASSVGNRIETGSNVDITISQGGGATLMYDGDAAYWRVIGIKN
jgi:hypothetical protein